jgi:hypothetical protein
VGVATRAESEVPRVTSDGALLIAMAGAGLVRITADSVKPVAAWPGYWEANQVEIGRWDGEEAYYVDFGRNAARFSASRSEWYAPRACVAVTSGVNNKCRCGEVSVPKGR